MSFSTYFSGETFQGSTEFATVEFAFANGEPLEELEWTVIAEINGNGNSIECKDKKTKKKNIYNYR